MAGFIDIACNFTHPSFEENLDQVLLEAKAVDVKKFVLLCASLNDLKPMQKIRSLNPSQFFITAGIHPHYANEILNLNEMPLVDRLMSIEPQNPRAEPSTLAAPRSETMYEIAQRVHPLTAE